MFKKLNRLKFAIRDDDVSFWTKPQELEMIYKEIWEKGIPVSLGIIPFSVKFYFPGDREKFYQGEELKPVGENKDLVEFLKEKIKENRISVMLHGFSHQYKVAKNKIEEPVLATKENLDRIRDCKDKVKLRWYGEYNWKSYEQMKKETRIGKEYLEDLFHTKVRVFVPPSNDISKDGVRAVSECGLNISGTILLSKFNRPVNLYSIKNWILRLWWRLKYNVVYPYVMDYKTHRELCAYGLIPGIMIDRLKSDFEFCQEKGSPFVLATHHWEISKNDSLRVIFENFIDFVYNQEVEPVFINEVIR